MSARPTILRTPLTDVERDTVERALSVYGSLVDDLRDVLQHGWPSRELLEVEGSPLLTDWRVADRRLLALDGRVDDRPGRTRTSIVIVHSPEAGVARTQSRWYRLGERSGDGK